jgi:hypothetical protein
VIPGTSPKKSPGRPLAARTVAIRDAILGLPHEYEQMTVRGIFYVLASKLNIVPKDDITGYRPVQRQALKLRQEGLLPWNFIADGTRWVHAPEMWDSSDDALQEAVRTYRRNLWRTQDARIEIWLEKDALASLISRVTYKWGVRLLVSRGQSSETYCHNAAHEARDAWEQARLFTVVYALYDSDRYGRTAAAKIEEKLRRYSGDAPIEFELLAVTDEQIADWDLPTRPAKTDGDADAVELDAIPPDLLTGLVDDAIQSHIDGDAWTKEQVIEASEREILARLAGAAS